MSCHPPLLESDDVMLRAGGMLYVAVKALVELVGTECLVLRDDLDEQVSQFALEQIGQAHRVLAYVATNPDGHPELGKIVGMAEAARATVNRARHRQ